MTDAEIIAAFEARRAERLAKEWGSYAPRNPIASDLGDCRRYQVMRIIAWQVREVPDARGIATIEHGRVMEPAIIAQLQSEGWEIVETQTPFEIRQPLEPGGAPKRILSGRIDGKVRIGRELAPFDAKDTSEWTLDGIDTEADLQSSPWLRKWWRQIQVYLLGENAERGFLVLAFRGLRKIIPIYLDYAAAEQLLQLATWAVRTVEALEAEGVTFDTVDAALNERGEPYHADFSICRSCPFRDRACFPPTPALGAVQDRQDLAEDVARYVEIKLYKSEAEKLRKRLQAQTEGYAQTVAGDFVVEGRVATRRMKEQPAKPAHVQEWWDFDVRRVGERGGADNDAA